MSNAKVDLLKDIIENDFNILQFRKFTREFFNGPEMLSSTKHTGIWKEYSENINAYYEIANYTDSENNEIIVLAVELKKGNSVHNARSLQRNFISKILSENNIEAAIVAFYTENQSTWRLSFVRLDYALKENQLTIDLTPAKRYSYLVGESESNHTAISQLVPIFVDDKNNPTLSEIENAFSVEKVTNDFFNQYKEKYLELKEFLEKNPSFIEESKKLGFKVEKFSEQFAKKLMGQLAFLYFIQKKGWLGVRIMPENHTFTTATYNNFFDSQDSIHRNVLKKVFVQNSNESVRLSSNKIEQLNNHEIDLLSECFVNSEFNMPWDSGNKKFIRDIFDFCTNNTNKNFFEEYLEPLFYEALNEKRKNQYFRKFNCKIPFLNGGLFDPLEGYNWKDINLEIPNEMFSNVTEKGREATGILDIFDRYNFTINENEPLEQDVAIDPEMLGKIFENLLDVTDRKSKGAYYTPREIVHYMCQESIINYLVNKVNVPYDDIKQFIIYGELIRDADNRSNVGFGTQLTIKQSVLEHIVDIDQALENIKIADPAVGSGAFPLGMLNEIVRARNNITEYIVKIAKKDPNRKYLEQNIRKQRSLYKIKWNTIKNSIFAVDIEASAVDITKLRLWLSMVVEQEIDEDNREPQTLPNLDMNIHVGNSLVSNYKGIKLFDRSMLVSNKIRKNSSNQLSYLFFNSDEVIDKLTNKKLQYYEENNRQKKRDLKDEIGILSDELIIHRLTETGNEKFIPEYNKIKDAKSKPFFIWELEFIQVFKNNGGFDVIIGNPPYVKEYTNKKVFEPLKNNKYYQGKMDLWYFFGTNGINLLSKNGIECFIAPNNWITNDGASKFRNKVLEETEIKIFVDFGNYKVFNSAAIQTMIYLLTKKKPKKVYEVNYSKLLTDVVTVETLNSFLYGMQPSSYYTKYNCKFEPALLKDKYINFHKPEIKDILDKMLVNAEFLNNNEAGQGIVAPQDVLNGKSADVLGPTHEVGEGVFVLNNDELESLCLQNAEKIIVKPYYTAEEMSKYTKIKENRKWILYCDSDMNSNIENFPNIKKHLDKYFDIITSSNKPYGLHRARNEELFQNEKILSLRKCSEPTFTYVNEDSYVSQSYYIIKTKRFDNMYLTGLFNSKLIKFWLHFQGKMQGDNYQIDKEPITGIPIAIPNDTIQNNIALLVNNVINCKLDKKDTNALEHELDALVYELYSLDKEDIKIIERSIN